ncbi:MAG: DUF2125 domain-containing protein [Xanthobacteraceae bacterium]
MPRRPGSAPAAAGGKHRRLSPILIAVAILAILAAGWCGLWYYAASVADGTLAGWVAREARAGRVYTCGSQDISGFPFRIEARCVQASASLGGFQPPLGVAAKEITFTAPVYHPTTLLGDVTGPLTVAPPGQPPWFVATWSLATMSLSGLPPNPDAFSVAIEQPHLDHGSGASAATLFAADNAVFQARIISGSANDHPVVDAVLHFKSATAPAVHPLLTKPLQGDVEVVLRGLKDLSPKSLADRFREMQTSGGSIEIKSLRIERPNAIVTGTGTLTLNQHGQLNGAISIAIAGLDNIVPELGIDQLLAQGINRLTGTSGPSGQGLSALDRLVPGLGGVVRDSANASVVDDLKKMGKPTQIDDKPATALPLRFSNGSVFLGMIRIGEVPPLF